MKKENQERFNRAIIRPYREEDESQVLNLVHELEEELAEKFPNVQIESAVQTYRLRYLQKGNKYVIYVAEVDGKVVGFLLGYPSLGIPEVDSLYDVLPLENGQLTEEFYLQPLLSIEKLLTMLLSMAIEKYMPASPNGIFQN